MYLDSVVSKDISTDSPSPIWGTILRLSLLIRRGSIRGIFLFGRGGKGMRAILFFICTFVGFAFFLFSLLAFATFCFWPTCLFFMPLFSFFPFFATCFFAFSLEGLGAGFALGGEGGSPVLKGNPHWGLSTGDEPESMDFSCFPKGPFFLRVYWDMMGVFFSLGVSGCLGLGTSKIFT